MTMLLILLTLAAVGDFHPRPETAEKTERERNEKGEKRQGEARRNPCSVKLVLEFPDVALDLRCGAIWSQSARAHERRGGGGLE